MKKIETINDGTLNVHYKGEVLYMSPKPHVSLPYKVIKVHDVGGSDEITIKRLPKK